LPKAGYATEGTAKQAEIGFIECIRDVLKKLRERKLNNIEDLMKGNRRK
jgi:hypothetical protein